MVEARYAVRHHGIPFLWLAKPFLIGSGVSGFKMAEFQNFWVPASDVSRLRVEVQQALGPAWSTLVETANRNGEWSVIYVRPDTGRMKMLMLSSEPSGGLSVMQMKVNPAAMNDWVDEPVKTAKHPMAK